MLFKTSLPLNPPSKSILIIFEREIGIIQRNLSDSYLIGIIPMVSRFHWIFIGNVTLCGVIFKAQWLQILSVQLYLSTVFFASLLQFVLSIQSSFQSNQSCQIPTICLHLAPTLLTSCDGWFHMPFSDPTVLINWNSVGSRSY